MKPIRLQLLVVLLLVAAIAGVGLAWRRSRGFEGERAARIRAAEAESFAAQRAVTADEAAELACAVEEPALAEEAEAEELLEIASVGGGAGSSFGGRAGGRRTAHGAGARLVRDGAPSETYVAALDPGFRDARAHPYSTFSVDVDTASFTNVRRFLDGGELPPPEAVRVEELLNAFEHRYPSPSGEHPLAVYAETASCPWSPEHRLLHVALQAARVDAAERMPVDLVFLVDVSGSMNDARKLPLVVAGLKLLAERLDRRDTVAIVTYASGVRTALETTPGHHTDGILAVLDGLRAGGSTNGEGGIQRAYALAEAAKRPGAEARVILATDGDFNVGVSDREELVALIAEKAKAGVSLTVLGFGTGNLKDATLEQLADRGDGHYAYVDSELEARRLFGDGLAGTLVTVAKDVKLQLELNPLEVASYRLVGYANRRLADRDFNDDAKDAGDVGAGHSVTALYELVPTALAGAAFDGELATVKVRYKRPGATESTAFETVVRDSGADWVHASLDLRFAAATAMFGEALAGSPHRGSGTLARAQLMLLAALGDDPRPEREALLDLVRRARELGAL